MKRLFVAADIPSEAKLFASDLIERLRKEHPVKGVSWSKPENLHVTIKFLGDTEPEREEKLIETLSQLLGCSAFNSISPNCSENV